MKAIILLGKHVPPNTADVSLSNVSPKQTQIPFGEQTASGSAHSPSSEQSPPNSISGKVEKQDYRPAHCKRICK